MEQRNLKLTLEQAKNLLVTNPELQEIIYNSFPELKSKQPIVPDSWDKLGDIGGYYFYSDCTIHTIKYTNTSNLANKNVATTEKHCLSMLAFAQLSQLMKATGDCDVDWSDEKIKYCILRRGLEVTKFDAYLIYYNLAFKTEAVRDEFLQKHQDLIKQYFML
jgi:hypothetical protein